MGDISGLSVAPTVLRDDSINPLSVLLGQQRQRQQQAYNQQRLNQQANLAREKGFTQLMETDLTKPGSFQREESIKEENDFRKKISDIYFKNPNKNPNEVRYETQNDRGEVERRRAKRMEVGDTIKNITEIARKDKNIDPTALANVVMREHTNFDVKSGKLTPKEIDEIDKEKIAQSVEHPSVYKADNAIIDLANNLKGGISAGTISPEFATALGTARQGIFGKMKFYQTDADGQPLLGKDGLPIPGVSQNLIEYVKESNPKVENKFLWDIAKQQHEAAGGNPDDLQAIDKLYENIAHDPDQKAKFQPQVDQRIKEALGVHQKLEHNVKIQNQTKFSEGQRKEPQEVDYEARSKKLHALTNPYGAGNKETSPDKNSSEAAGELIGEKYGNFPITDANYVKGNKSVNFLEYIDDVNKAMEEAKGDEELMAFIKEEGDKLRSTGPQNNLLVLRVQTAKTSSSNMDQGEGKPITVPVVLDLSKPESKTILHGILNERDKFEKRTPISYDKLKEYESKNKKLKVGTEPSGKKKAVLVIK